MLFVISAGKHAIDPAKGTSAVPTKRWICLT